MIQKYIEPIGIGAGVFLALVLIAWLPYVIWQYRRHGALRGRRILAQTAFVLYLACAWMLVLAPFPQTQAAACARPGVVQLEPFRWVTDVQNSLARAGGTNWRTLLTNAALFVRLFNVALTIPFGVFLRRWYRRGFLITTIAGFALSLAFELTQITGIWGIYDCPYRTFDVDDLMANTLGASLGWLLAPAIVLLPKRSAHDDLRVTAAHPGVFRRLVAVIVDLGLWALLYVVGLFATIAVASVFNASITPRVLSSSLWSAMFLLVFVVIPAASGGATPGQFLLHLSVGRAADPKRPAALWQHLVRAIVVFAPLALAPTIGAIPTGRPNLQVGLVLGIPIVWLLVLGASALLRADRRSVADLLAGTIPVVVVPDANDQLDTQRTSAANPK